MFSNQTGEMSSNLSHSLMNDIICFLHISITPQNLLHTHLILRKIGHLTEYAILTFLIYKNLFVNDMKRFIIIKTLMFCFIYASLDELHQAFVPCRGPSFVDVLIDLSGGILMILGILLSKKVFHNK